MRSSVKLRETTIGAAVVAALASGACGSADRVSVEADETPEAAVAAQTIGVPCAEVGRWEGESSGGTPVTVTTLDVPVRLGPLSLSIAIRLVPFATVGGRPRKIRKGSVRKEPPPAITFSVPATRPTPNKLTYFHPSAVNAAFSSVGRRLMLTAGRAGPNLCPARGRANTPGTGRVDAARADGTKVGKGLFC